MEDRPYPLVVPSDEPLKRYCQVAAVGARLDRDGGRPLNRQVHVTSYQTMKARARSIRWLAAPNR